MNPEQLMGLVVLAPDPAHGVWRAELVSVDVLEGFVGHISVGLFPAPPGDGYLDVAEVRRALLAHLGAMLVRPKAA